MLLKTLMQYKSWRYYYLHHHKEPKRLKDMELTNISNSRRFGQLLRRPRAAVFSSKSSKSIRIDK